MEIDIQISFVILSYNSKKYLKDCLDSVIYKCKEEKIPYEVILIDNGSEDESLNIVKDYEERYYPHIKKISFSRNMGTTYPRNLGLLRALGEYICIIDSDTKICSGSIVNILKFLDNNNDIGILAPQLILPDGSIQASVKKFPTFWHKISKLPKAVFNRKISNDDFYRDFPFKYETPVDSAISACWFLRKELLLLVGFFDDKIFYSPEDLDYCLRVRLTGKKIIYYPYLTILHHTQQMSHKKPFSRISMSHFFGLLYYFHKHGGWFSTKAIYSKFADRNIKYQPRRL